MPMEFLKENDKLNTPIYFFDTFQSNKLYMKREDLTPFSFGGNKVRKALSFFKEIDAGDYDCVVTYGSSSSNHCRVVANLAASRGIECYIIAPAEASEVTFNSKLMELFAAEINVVPVINVHKAIEDKLAFLKEKGKNPYFIAGGGHGNIGTQSFVECYEEIRNYEKENDIFFDYIFLASGTGTTQAGLVCAQLMHKDQRKIVGISIARKNPRGRKVVLGSINEYFDAQKIDVNKNLIEENTIFLDDYIGDGYGGKNRTIETTIKYIMLKYGIHLDATYTGKAFVGMKKHIVSKEIQGKNILFIHTGGTPLFFDFLGGLL